MENKLIKGRVKAITPLGTFESNPEEKTELEWNQVLKPLLHSNVENFRLPVGEDVMILPSEVVKNSIFVFEKIKY